MRVEHLLLFYAAELFLKACSTAHSKGPAVTEEKLEELYKRLEGRLSISESFGTLTANAEPLEALPKELFPTQPLNSIFYEEKFVNRQDIAGYWTDFSDGCRHEYKEGVAKKMAGDTFSCECPFPYLVILQSSGWEKSRLVLGGKANARSAIFDNCIRGEGEGEKGESVRTPHIAQAVLDGRTLQDYIIILAGCLGAMAAHVQRLPCRNRTRGIFPRKDSLVLFEPQ